MRLGHSARVVIVLAAWGVGVSSARAQPGSPFRTAVSAARSPKVGGRVPLHFVSRPSLTGGRIAAATRAPVVVEMLPVDVGALEDAGLVVARRADGSPVVRGRFVAGWVSADVLAALASLPRVRRVTADGAPFGLLPPLDTLGPEVQAPDAWRSTDRSGWPLTGAGQLICVIDTGIDVHHPMFFHADGGYHAWHDVDGDGAFSSGVDSTTDGVTLRTFKSVVFDAEGGVLFDTGSARHVADIHWVYADDNGNGKRDFGAAAGFDDATPSFGEPLYAADDVDGDGVLDAGERLVALKTSKVVQYTTGSFIHTRGVNMIEAPREGTYHGTASSSIVLGGQRGLTRLSGIAPDAELLMVKTGTISQLFLHTDFCLNRGARVVLHEYAPWQGFFLDGSSPLEQVIAGSMRGGVAHVHPAGNLAGAQKLWKSELPRNGTVDIPLTVPPDFEGNAFGLFAFSLLWRGELDDLEVTLEDATGAAATVTGAEPQPFHSGLSFVSALDASSRGTARADIYVFSDESASVTLTPGAWRVTVRDVAGSGPHELVGSVQDDQSRWAKGIHFPELANEEHLIGHPGTADVAIVVAAYTGHGFAGGSPGWLAAYSGRGRRLDGLELLSVAAPDDPIAATHVDGMLAPFGPFGGTSAASPHVAGAAALLLQAAPERTGENVRDALRAGALADEATGPVPNDGWGYGKLRIHRSLFGVDPPPGSAPKVAIPVTHVDAGERVTVRATIEDVDDELGALTIELDRDYDGVYDEVLDEPSFAVRFDRVGSHVLKLRVTDPTGRAGYALARVEVHSTYAPSGGLACRLHGEANPRWGWALALVGGALVGRRRRR